MKNSFQSIFVAVSLFLLFVTPNLLFSMTDDCGEGRSPCCPHQLRLEETKQALEVANTRHFEQVKTLREAHDLEIQMLKNSLENLKRQLRNAETRLLQMLNNNKSPSDASSQPPYYSDFPGTGFLE